MKAATSTAVKTIPSSDFMIDDDVLVKRKYKTAGDGSKQVIRWWFVVHFNARSLIQKLYELKVICSTVNLLPSVLLKLDCQMIYQMMRSPFLNTLLLDWIGTDMEVAL